MTKLFAASLLTLGLFTGILPSAAQAGSAQARAHNAACSIEFIVGRAACYAPTQVAKAEAQAPFAIRPSSAVVQVLGLQLSQVIVYRTDPNSRTPSQLYYLYGALRHDYGRAPALPQSVVVTVAPGRAQRMEERYTYQACGARFEISQAALNHPYRPWGPWYLRGNFAHGARQFTITANVRQPRLTQLACAIHQLG
jgi:hypothetical protein